MGVRHATSLGGAGQLVKSALLTGQAEVARVVCRLAYSGITPRSSERTADLERFSAPVLPATSETGEIPGLTNHRQRLKLSIGMDWLHNQDARAVWEAWQARKQASHEADQCALASGEKTREQLDRENSAVPDDVA
ncbi:MAG TPA: hypothetical protein VF331_00240, partial [Polyangiales bacterium]